MHPFHQLIRGQRVLYSRLAEFGRVHSVAVLTVLMLGLTFVLGAPASIPAATASAVSQSAPVASFESPGTDLTWRMALVVYLGSTSGAQLETVGPAQKRRDLAIGQFQRITLDATDGRFGVSVDVFIVPLWSGVRVPSVVPAGQYDIVAHMYPKFESEPMATDIGVVYKGLAGPEAGGGYFHEYPVKTDGALALSGDLFWHETLHTVTQFLKSTGALSDDMLPPGDVHGYPVSYPSEASYFRAYVRGEVELDGRSGLGLGVDRLVNAGPPRLWPVVN